jgi:formate dehydrogenase major subunit
MDCLTCEVNGNCELQEVAARTGITEVRYQPGANHLEQEKDCSHPYMRCPTGALSDVFLSKSVRAEKKVRTICSYCGVGCNLEVAVSNNQVVSIQAPKDAAVNAGHTCVKGRYAFRFYNHPDRLSSPLIRRNGELQAASWDEAYDYIAEKLQKIKAEHGPDAIGGIASSRCANEENYLLQKFMRAVIGTNNVDCCARVCHSPTAYGMQQSFGTGAATNSIEDIKYTDAIMLIGANPMNAHPVTGSKIKQHALKGKTLVVIDPLKTELAQIATFHLQLRPGTNVAMLNMMAYYIIEAGLVDKAFVDSRTEGWDEFESGIRALDIAKMEAVTGVDRALAKAAALAYANAGNAMTFHGLGVTEHTQGSRAVMKIANFNMMTGNIGRRGVGMNPLRGQNNVQGAADMGCQPHQGAGYKDVTSPEVRAQYEAIYGVPVPGEVGMKIPEMLDAGVEGKLKAIWIMGDDPAQTDPNTAHVKKALAAMDLVVVQEIFLSETAMLADVVLPGTSYLEKNGTFTNGERRIQRVNQAVTPLAGTKVDGQIIVDIMNRMGYAQADYDAAEMLKEISRCVPFFEGVTWERLGDNGKQWPVKADGSDTQILHTETFSRGLGKFHFFEFEESAELEEHSARFPFILTTGRNLEHYNCGTMTRRTGNREIMSEDTLLVHPEDAKSKGIEQGQQVRLTSDRGEIKLTADVTDRVNPGVVRTTFHFPEQMVNSITSSVTDREAKCPEFKVIAVDLEAIA